MHYILINKSYKSIDAIIFNKNYRIYRLFVILILAAFVLKSCGERIGFFAFLALDMALEVAS